MKQKKSSEKKSCVYCGAAPVPHTLEYASKVMTILTSNAFPKIPKKLYLLLSRFLMPVITITEKIMLGTLEKIGVVTFTEDTALTDRTQSILDEAKKRNIPMQTARIFGKLIEHSRAQIPGTRTWFYFESLPIPQYVNNSVVVWVDNKNVFNTTFTKNNLPVVKSSTALSMKRALKIFDSLAKPVITKPQYGSRARHTTVDITDKDEFKRAFKRAQQLCPSVVIEEFKRGTLYRATVIGKKVIGIIEFVKPKVEADGTHTVLELLEFHNTHKKYPHLTDVKNDAWFTDAITHQGLSTGSIPEKGRIVYLSEHSERPNGGYFIDITDEVPQENIDLIERAAQVTELDVIGFDIISENLKEKHSLEPFVFIEGNSLPFIELHMVLYEGKKRDTPKAVWDLWQKK